MDSVQYYGCYDYNEEWYLVEMLLDLSASDIDWVHITVPEEGVNARDWQCAYMEQYLNQSGTKKLCKTYCQPDDDAKPCRVAFFIYKVSATTLHTPYGDFELQTSDKVPERLADIIEFEAAD